MAGKARCATHPSSTRTKLYGVRDAKGRFKDIQTYKRAHGQDIKAALAHRAGFSREYVNKIEAGRYDPTVGVLQRLAKALGVPVTALLE